MVAENRAASSNERLAREINQEARSNPNSPYAGKRVGIAHGRVIVVADSWREVVERLREVEPDPTKCYCLDASADYDRVDEIWSIDRTGHMSAFAPLKRWFPAPVGALGV